MLRLQNSCDSVKSDRRKKILDERTDIYMSYKIGRLMKVVTKSKFASFVEVKSHVFRLG